MAKQVKSVRMDEELVNVFSEYANLVNEMFGYSVSLSALVNESLAECLMNSAQTWIATMKSKTVVDPQPNGKMKQYEFTDEQIKRMEAIHNNAASIYAVLQK